MKYIKLSFIFFLSLFTVSEIQAAQSPDVIVIDAGSSHSELFVFHMTPKAKGLPTIQTTFHAESELALSQQVNNPSGVAEWVLDLTKNCPTQLDPSTPIYVMGTAGMRLLSDDQQHDLYQAVTAELQNQTHFQPKFVGTIDGQQEGIFGWLTVNYLSNRLDNPKLSTVGVMDMGGGSTEITFESMTAPQSKDRVMLNLGPYQFSLFSHSFLGLGHNEALNRAGVASCFPTGTPLSDGSQGQFDFSACVKANVLMLQDDHVMDIVPTVRNKTFVAITGFYYTFDFFNSLVSPEKLDNNIQKSCKQPWQNFAGTHPGISEKYLKTYCFNGVYDYTLMMNGYHHLLKHNMVKVLDTIKDTDLDWTLGAALYYYMQ